MSYVQGQSLASAASSGYVLVDNPILEQSGSASSTAFNCGGNLYDLMLLEEDSDAVSSRGQCKGLHGFSAAIGVWVASWQDMRKGKRVTKGGATLQILQSHR